MKVVWTLGIAGALVFTMAAGAAGQQAAKKPAAKAKLPAAVADAFKKLYPKATITKAERTTEGQTVKYELAVKGAPKREVSFMPDGKPVGPEPKK